MCRRSNTALLGTSTSDDADKKRHSPSSILIIGGAGGVGSITIQLAKSCKRLVFITISQFIWKFQSKIGSQFQWDLTQFYSPRYCLCNVQMYSLHTVDKILVG